MVQLLDESFLALYGTCDRQLESSFVDDILAVDQVGLNEADGILHILWVFSLELFQCLWRVAWSRLPLLINYFKSFEEDFLSNISEGDLCLSIRVNFHLSRFQTLLFSSLSNLLNLFFQESFNSRPKTHLNLLTFFDSYFLLDFNRGAL